jgi:hypothetical protein
MVDGLTRVVDEIESGFGWIGSERPRLQLASHALAASGGVWILDPTNAPELDDRIGALGEPAGVVQLLDRHNRACAEVARRLDVPHHRVPFGGVAGAPFEVVPVVGWNRWNEVALWWPEQRVLVCADAFGTVPHYFAVGGERLGVHPLLRLTPPSRLGRFGPEHVLCGHGEGVHEHATAAVREALAGSRRRLVRLPGELLLSLRRRSRGERAG